MHVGRHTTAQSAEIHSFGVHLSTWFTVGKERVKFRGESVRKNQPLVPRSNIAGSWTRGGGGRYAAGQRLRTCLQSWCSETPQKWHSMAILGGLGAAATPTPGTRARG